MKVELDFILIRAARQSGGDRYEHGTRGLKGHMLLYVPQFYSRVNGTPIPTLHVTIADFTNVVDMSDTED